MSTVLKRIQTAVVQLIQSARKGSTENDSLEEPSKAPGCNPSRVFIIKGKENKSFSFSFSFFSDSFFCLCLLNYSPIENQRCIRERYYFFSHFTEERNVGEMVERSARRMPLSSQCLRS
jgi:hypothetical protein